MGEVELHDWCLVVSQRAHCNGRMSRCCWCGRRHWTPERLLENGVVGDDEGIAPGVHLAAVQRDALHAQELLSPARLGMNHGSTLDTPRPHSISTHAVGTTMAPPI